MSKFENIFQYKLIYIFEIRDDAHKGLLKIGDTTISTDYNLKDLLPNCKILNQAANKRIKQYTNTAGIDAHLLHTELAIYRAKDKDGKEYWKAFRDYDVHRVLLNSKVKKKSPKGSTGREWFAVDLKTARQAIKAVKLNLNNLSGSRLESEEFVPITLRPEQEEAIDLAIKQFKTGNSMLWNAKMRFGKTLSALELVRRAGFAKTIIITHRPVVDVGWYEDFKKIFHGESDYLYGSKNTGYKQIDELLNSGKNFVYFASMQDLRGSDTVGGKFSKNAAVFNADWDFVIVDEAHEGTTTALGDSVIKSIVKDNTKFLALSGTPFNILGNYEENIYTWDYISEQRRKAEWAEEHFGDSNPYDELPKMNIYTYNLGDLLKNSAYVELEDKAFNFREFFRTNDKGDFVHESDIKNFLNLLIKPSDDNYPYSTEEYRELFRHSLWIIPGVRAGKALSRLLKSHDVFKNFEIVNVAGNGDDDEESADALEKVRNAIDNNDYTITLSCGKLTTGVTVPEWTAVFMLAGSFSTSAASYLQTIFRVQSPCNKDGKIKQNCYVFDFAPDRTLKMIAESAAISAKAGKTDDNDRRILDELLNFCPIIAFDGSKMKEYDTNKLLQQLKRAYAERAVQNGFDDTNLYNDSLLKLDDLDIEKFNKLKGIVGSSRAQSKTNTIDINGQGFSKEEYEVIKRAGRKPQRELTDKEKALLEEIKQKNKMRAAAISILRQISIRIPLLIYGADVPIDEDFTLDMLFDIDEASWNEFMPAGVTKNRFRDFIKYYDPEVFVGAGHKIRNIARSADELPPTERVKKIAELFSTFKNPDKETVLTPWRVVNLHMSDCLGGYDFFDERHEKILEIPRFVDCGQATSDTFANTKSKILEINSKTGLYPLYVTYSIYRARLGSRDEKDLSLDELRRIWDETVRENIFVICKTPMAKAITKRTLTGFREVAVNAHYFEKLINDLKNESDKFVRRVKSESLWKKGNNFMKFDAVVGNPPYQEVTENTSDKPIYHEFLKTSFKIADKVSLIHPARCLSNAGKTPKEFNQKLLESEHIKIVRCETDSTKIFPTTDIKGGIAITYYDKNEKFEPIGTFISFEELKAIHKKVVLDNKNFKSLSEIVFAPESFHLTEKFHKDNPEAKKLLSEGHDYDLTTNIFDKLKMFFFDSKPIDEYEYIQIYGLENKKRTYKWIRRDYVRNDINLDYFKVMLPKSNGSGAIGEVLSTPLVGLPLVGCTQTFITIGAFDTREEAQACLSYIKSKFARVMLGILKVTQDNKTATWAKVPLQDFTSNSDIDWSKTISEIDAQLYKKYNLNDVEINFIETNIQPMS